MKVDPCTIDRYCKGKFKSKSGYDFVYAPKTIK